MHSVSNEPDLSAPPRFATDFRREFIGMPIDCLTRAETVALAEAAMRERRSLRQVSINVAKFIAMRSDPELDRDVRSGDLISIDGMGILWAARLLGIEVSERVAGVDLMEDLLELCAEKGYRPYFLGARPAVLEAAVASVSKRMPGIRFAGAHDGYFTPAEEAAVVAEIRAARADCLFIGMPTPRKERFLARYVDELGVPFIMGVGGGLDVLSGEIRRASALVQELGLEWLYRTLQEPRRLLPRYLKTNARFAAVLAKAWLRKCLRTSLRGSRGFGAGAAIRSPRPR